MYLRGRVTPILIFVSASSIIMTSNGYLDFFFFFSYLDRLIIEDDSAMIISWLIQPSSVPAAHPIICDIRLILQDCYFLFIMHIYREINSTVDRIVFFVAQHSSFVLWSDWHSVSV